MEQETDSELIARVRAGEKNAFALLVERYQAMVRHIVAGMIAREDYARELVQEAILHAYLSLEHLRDPTRFRSWLYGITLNICRGYSQQTVVISVESCCERFVTSTRPTVITLRAYAAMLNKTAKRKREMSTICTLKKK